MRSLLVLFAVVCFLLAALSNCDWRWFGIDENLQAHRMWLALGAAGFAGSFLSWDAWSQRAARRWHR